jgi:hypothetical protein
MEKRSPLNVRTLALGLLGIGLATSAAAMPLGGVELIHPTTTHGLLATVGLLGLAFGGRTRD